MSTNPAVAECKFIKFVPDSNHGGWYVENKKFGDGLGRIDWYPRWKQYVFSATQEAMFSHDCLLDISNFMQAQTKARKAK